MVYPKDGGWEITPWSELENELAPQIVPLKPYAVEDGFITLKFTCSVREIEIKASPVDLTHYYRPTQICYPTGAILKDGTEISDIANLKSGQEVKVYIHTVQIAAFEDEELVVHIHPKDVDAKFCIGGLHVTTGKSSE